MPKPKRNLTDEEKQKIAEAKKELNEYKENIKYIEEKLNDAEETACKLEKITPTLSLTKTNAFNISTDKFGDAISRLEELKLDCSKKMEQLLLKKFIIDEKIDSMEQPYKNILFYRYTRAKSWEQVSNELNYTREYICDLHGKALYIYSKI